MRENIYCFDDTFASGEYFSLDLTVWKQLEYKIDAQKRLRVVRSNYDKDIRVFVMVGDKDNSITVDGFVMLDRKQWAELRKIRGEERGLPLEVGSNGSVWVGEQYSDKNFMIFVRI
jgi:hypothetical protein